MTSPFGVASTGGALWMARVSLSSQTSARSDAELVQSQLVETVASEASDACTVASGAGEAEEVSFGVGDGAGAPASVLLWPPQPSNWKRLTSSLTASSPVQ